VFEFVFFFYLKELELKGEDGKEEEI